MKFFEDLIRKENLIARVVCLLIACGLWVYVMTDQNPIVERNVEVRLQQMNLPSNMMVFNAPNKVMVKVRGTRTKVSDNLENRITASLNLKSVTEGQQTVPVKVSFASGDVVQVIPSEVSVYVDTVSEKKVPVITRIVGAVSNDLTIGHSTITPAQVTLRGATHRIDKVNKVVAPIDVTDHSGDFQAESELVAVSDDGYDIPNMKIIPERVMVHATMVSQMLSVDIPVKLVVSGELPKGVTVTKTEILPEKVRITAPPSLLKELKAINTKPVDVSKLVGSTAVAAELDLPEKVLPEVRTVQIRLSVERQSQ
ncbi:MAG: YbbR-like domain-containing protein [Phascolarctobacterium sp.]